MTTIERSALVPYSAEQMFRLVDDIENYPAFMQGCLKARVIERSEDEVVGELTLGKAGITQSFTTRNRLDPPHAMEMALVEGPFSDFSALWTFDPLSDSACKVSLRMHFRFSGGLMGLALNKLFNHSANALVDDIVAQAGRLYGDD
ncbi:MAG: type II toxin-antitoxin system RatA family toxin [Pseudohongiellaceae bacterium]